MSNSYLIELERLRAELVTILRDKGFTIADDATLNTLIPKVDGIGTYDIINSILTAASYVLNDTEGVITAVSSATLKGNNITSLTLPECVSISAQAFFGCKLLTTVSLDKCETLNNEVFDACIALTNVSIPAIKTIGSNTFLGCTALREIELPTTITSLAGQAFYGCTSLNKLIIRKTDSVLSITSNTFNNTPFRNGSGGIVYVPDDLVSTYQSALYWSSLESTTFKGLSELD